MTSKVTISNENKNTGFISHLSKTVGWTFALIFLPQLVLSFGFGIFFGVQQGSDYTPEAFNLWFSSVPVLLTLTLISPLLTFPLLKKASQAKNWNACLEFCALKKVDASVCAKWLIIGFIYWSLSSLAGLLFNIPVEQFMLDIRSTSDNITNVVLVVLTICIVVPIMEELIFRGWLYSKIEQSRLGKFGALVLSSIIFTAIHTQYENTVTLVIIFLLGFLLGFVRFRSGNISYCIAIHMLFNSLAIFALFLL